jgi:hypothetical protein
MPIYLYYNNIWNQIDGELENTGEYMWDTTSLPDGTYTLLVEAVDSDGNVGNDESDHFEIKNHDEPLENLAPDKPNKPFGPVKGKAGEEYTYNSFTTDPDDDKVWFIWDWGDGSSSGWLGPYTSGETCDASHVWSEKDDYNIRVKARDEYGKESSWSDPLGISMPVNKHVYYPVIKQKINRLIQLYPIIGQLLSIFFNI